MFQGVENASNDVKTETCRSITWVVQELGNPHEGSGEKGLFFMQMKLVIPGFVGNMSLCFRPNENRFMILIFYMNHLFWFLRVSSTGESAPLTCFFVAPTRAWKEHDSEVCSGIHSCFFIETTSYGGSGAGMYGCRGCIASCQAHCFVTKHLSGEKSFICEFFHFSLLFCCFTFSAKSNNCLLFATHDVTLRGLLEKYVVTSPGP